MPLVAPTAEHLVANRTRRALQPKPDVERVSLSHLLRRMTNSEQHHRRETREPQRSPIGWSR